MPEGQCNLWDDILEQVMGIAPRQSSRVPGSSVPRPTPDAQVYLSKSPPTSAAYRPREQYRSPLFSLPLALPRQEPPQGNNNVGGTDASVPFDCSCCGSFFHGSGTRPQATNAHIGATKGGFLISRPSSTITGTQKGLQVSLNRGQTMDTEAAETKTSTTTGRYDSSTRAVTETQAIVEDYSEGAAADALEAAAEVQSEGAPDVRSHTLFGPRRSASLQPRLGNRGAVRSGAKPDHVRGIFPVGTQRTSRRESTARSVSVGG